MRAIAAQRAGDARTYVVTDAQKRVVAYHSLAAASVSRHTAPGRLRRNAPQPIPAILIARLAVERQFQGRRLGKLLLRDAVLRSLAAADSIGARLLLAHALDDDAAGFYMRFGFIRSDQIRNLVMARIEDVRMTVPDARP